MSITTIAEARDLFRAEAHDKGVECPACKQFVKVYRRKIHSGMARALIAVYLEAGTDWTQNPTAFVTGRMGSGGDPLKLRYWGLLEKGEAKRSDGSNRAGVWRVTELGKQFVLRDIELPKYALVYNGDCIGHDGELVGILDAIGDKFDYDEAMGNAK